MKFDIKISETDKKKITSGCIKQGEKYGFPKAAKKKKRKK
jgi:hypothetical protein